MLKDREILQAAEYALLRVGLGVCPKIALNLKNFGNAFSPIIYQINFLSYEKKISSKGKVGQKLYYFTFSAYANFHVF